jgi:hypothetical protein
LQYFRAASGQYSGDDLNFVVHLPMIQHLDYGMNRPGFGIFRPVNKALDACMHDRAGTHRARFNCNKQLALTQTMVTNGSTGFSQRDNFGVRCWIRSLDVSIRTPTHDVPVTHHNSSDRNFANFKRALRTAECLLHPQFVA